MWVAGPSAGGVLADWGADVIKVEGPEGDPMRGMLAVTGGGRADLPSPPFDLDNRGKRSIVLDLADPDGPGRAAMEKLPATADVFLTNLRPDAVERLGLGPDAVLAANPRLIYASVTGYGRTGPDAHRAGYDVGGFWARSGIASLAVPPDQPAAHFRGGMGDHVTRHDDRRRHRHRPPRAGAHGPGPPARDVAAPHRHLVPRLGPQHAAALRDDRGHVAAHGDARPDDQPLPRRRRRWFWLLGVEGDRLWVKLLPAIGREEWATDERFDTGRNRRHHATELIALLDALFATKPLDEWTALFDEHDVVGAGAHARGGRGRPAGHRRRRLRRRAWGRSGAGPPGRGVAGGVPDARRRPGHADPTGARPGRAHRRDPRRARAGLVAGAGPGAPRLPPTQPAGRASGGGGLAAGPAQRGRGASQAVGAGEVAGHGEQRRRAPRASYTHGRRALAQRRRPPVSQASPRPHGVDPPPDEPHAGEQQQQQVRPQGAEHVAVGEQVDGPGGAAPGAVQPGQPVERAEVDAAGRRVVEHDADDAGAPPAAPSRRRETFSPWTTWVVTILSCQVCLSLSHSIQK